MPMDPSLIAPKWISNDATGITFAASSATYNASAVASIGQLQTNVATMGSFSNRATHIMLANRSSDGYLFIETGTTDSAPATATIGSGQMVPPNSVGIFPIPRGGGNAQVKIIASPGTVNGSISWGLKGG